jgi:hypothetical protein
MTRKPKRGQGTASQNARASYETVRELARALPGVVEGIAYGTAALRVAKRLFARQHELGDLLVIRIDPNERAMRMNADPEAYFITDHYRNYPWMLVRLSAVDRDDLRELLEDAWRLSAPKRLLATRDRAPVTPSRRAPPKPRGD